MEIIVQTDLAKLREQEEAKEELKQLRQEAEQGQITLENLDKRVKAIEKILGIE
jgi:hypothetical protein